MIDEQSAPVQSRRADGECTVPCTSCLLPVPTSNLNSSFQRGEVGGRVIIDELPQKIGLLPGEAELVAQHLLAGLDTLFATALARQYTSGEPDAK